MTEKTRLVDRFLNAVERVGNKLPDPALLFVFALAATWLMSALLSGVDFSAIDPRTSKPIIVQNLLTGSAIAAFLANMVKAFTDFPPLGVVLVALLGVGVAEHTGFINAGLKSLLSITPRKLLTPIVVLVGIVSHTAVDAGYVLVIPLGAVIFHSAGRHPLAGIAAAFAGVSGGFSANFIPSGIDPLLQGFTQSAARILDTNIEVNPLCNWAFMSASSLLIATLGWIITDKFVEPRLKSLEIDGDLEGVAKTESLTPQEKRGLLAGIATMALGLLVLFIASYPSTSPLRSPEGQLAAFSAPLMKSIVPLIFLLFLIPGIVHGVVAGTVKTHRDVIAGMSKSMSTMGYYIVLAFCAALFTESFKNSNLGALLALEGAAFLKWLHVPSGVTIIGIILLTASVNLLIGSASAKWALLGPIFVPMLMTLGISPELTQAAYRVGDSTTNIITPLMPYFPLVVVFAQRWHKKTGIGTLVSMMLPYSLTFLTVWTAFLLIFWGIGIPLGIQASYTYPPT